jgi:hypothetical protein
VSLSLVLCGKFPARIASVPAKKQCSPLQCGGTHQFFNLIVCCHFSCVLWLSHLWYRVIKVFLVWWHCPRPLPLQNCLFCFSWPSGNLHYREVELPSRTQMFLRISLILVSPKSHFSLTSRPPRSF